MWDVMTWGYQAWDFLQSPTGAAILGALFILSEALAAIPQIKANSVFEAIYHGLAKLAGKQAVPVVLCMLFLAGCSTAQIQKTQTVVAALKADGKTLVVTGCKDLPAAEILVSVVPMFYPPSAAAITVGEQYADAFCAKVKAAQALQSSSPS